MSLKKDKLTLKNIRSDIRGIIFGAYGALIVLAIFIALFAVILHFAVKTGNERLAAFESAFFIIFLVIAAAVIVVFLLKLHIAYSSEPVIVTDKLVGLYEKMDWGTGYKHLRYYLVFAGYGEFLIPNENYRFSEYYSMSNAALFRKSDVGEEFYLVLSKRHNGKIYAAYSTRYFELEK